MALAMTIDELHEFLAEEFPQAAAHFHVERVQEGSIRVRRIIGPADLRPGGTVSGPAMFGLADVSIYLAVLAAVGPRKLAVTTNCAIDFMRKPHPGDLIADARILKLGRRLAVGDVLIHSDGDEVPVARASLTYSLPN